MAGRILVERRAAVAVITIDDPRTRNAITRAMALELADALRAADDDPEIGTLILTGANGAFSSGHNLHELRERPEEAWEADANAPFALPRLLRKPVVAAIEGPAYAGGLILALACDIRVAAENALLCASGARIGLLPIGGQLSWLPHLAPPGLVNEMLLTGEPLDAQRALQAGLVSQVVPTAQLEATAFSLAERIAANSRPVVQAIKRGVRLSLSAGIAAAEAFELSEAYKHGASSEAAERLAAALRPAGKGDAD